MRDWVNSSLTAGGAPGLQQQMLNRGRSVGQTILVAYADQDAYDGSCPTTGGWGYGDYSFVTMCVYFGDMSVACQRSDASGCAWVLDNNSHTAFNYQPSIWIRAGLGTPYKRRNTVHHELFHIVGYPHNLCTCSLMYGQTSSSSYQSLTSGDFDYVSGVYAHGMPE